MSALSDSPQGSRQYQRILIKMSGEALQGQSGFGIDPLVLDRMAVEMGELISIGVQVGLVVGGGNLFRGTTLSRAGLDRVTGDHMGMLATVMNALALRDALERADISSHVLSSIPMSGIVEHYNRRLAIHYLEQGDLVIFAAGTGNPFFTTDSAACLRAIEVEAELVLKATKVDGVHDADPERHKKTVKYSHLTYDEVLGRDLQVMDMTAICLCRERQMPIRVFKMSQAGALRRIIEGGDLGTLIDSGAEQ